MHTHLTRSTARALAIVILATSAAACEADEPTSDLEGSLSSELSRSGARAAAHVVDGQRVIQGDMVIVDKQMPLVQGQPLKGIASSAKYVVTWPGGIIPYVIDSKLPNKKRVTNAIAHWQERTLIRFVPR